MDFDSPASAQKAVTALKASGIQAQMAKVRGGGTKYPAYKNSTYLKQFRQSSTSAVPLSFKGIPVLLLLMVLAKAYRVMEFEQTPNSFLY